MSTFRLLVGDCRKMLRTLPDASVHCVVTSPPYWGLRDYGTATWEGGDPECAHRVGGRVPYNLAKDAIVAGVHPGVDASRCLDCGAQRVDSQLGLEMTPDEYVERMVEVFREVRRVLRDDGTLWLNLGDSYAAQRGGTHQPAETLAGAKGGRTEDGQRVNRGRHDGYNPTRNARAIGLKHKDLVGIPWRVAFALQADGWYLRSDIIWAKPNPMPESVRDRPTKAHEYVFLLTKSERYFYDAEAIAEQATDPEYRERGKIRPNPETAARIGKGFEIRGGLHNQVGGRSTRNARTVWTISTKPYRRAHFATFPPALAEKCILAGCPKGGTVLDPFAGSGTTGMVATGHGRHAVLIELSPDYAERIGPMLEAV